MEEGQRSECLVLIGGSYAPLRRERVQERRCMLGGELGEIARVLVEQPPCVYAPRNRWISSSHSAKPSRFFVVRSRSCIRRALRRETAFLAERRVLGSGSAG